MDLDLKDSRPSYPAGSNSGTLSLATLANHLPLGRIADPIAILDWRCLAPKLGTDQENPTCELTADHWVVVHWVAGH